VFNQCQEEKACLLSIDIARGVFGFNTAWFWASFQTVLKDGTIFAFNSGDGIGHQAYDSKERSTEDFISVNGKVFKLDASEMIYDQNDYMQPMQLQTTSENRSFKENSCDLKFKAHG
jgi:Protein of unknown function (DUF2804)